MFLLHRIFIAYAEKKVLNILSENDYFSLNVEQLCSIVTDLILSEAESNADILVNFDIENCNTEKLK